MSEEYWQTNKRCPKCGSRNFQIADTCAVDYLYECRDGIITANGQGDGCDQIKRTCFCLECEHSWHPKGDIFANYHSGLKFI